MADRQRKKDNDDFALFREEMRDATPIRQSGRLLDRPKPEVKIHRKPFIENGNTDQVFLDMSTPNTIGNEEYLEYRSPGIQHKLFSKLRTGKVHLEAELDLHGMTIVKAEAALKEFLALCQQQQIRCVRIIHGKGWGSQDNRPVLKNAINAWLRHSSSVLAFCSATVEDGGTGALYVLLKRYHSG